MAGRLLLPRHGRMGVSPEGAARLVRGRPREPMLAGWLRETRPLDLRHPLRRAHERAEDPEDREENPEEEQPPVPVPDGHHTERDHQHQVQDPCADTDSPPHKSSLGRTSSNVCPPTLTPRRSCTSPRPDDAVAIAIACRIPPR